MRQSTRRGGPRELRVTDPGFSSCLVCLLPGEVVQQMYFNRHFKSNVCRFDDVVLLGNPEVNHRGSAFLTNYRLVFCYQAKGLLHEKPLVPMGCIHRLMDGSVCTVKLLFDGPAANRCCHLQNRHESTTQPQIFPKGSQTAFLGCH